MKNNVAYESIIDLAKRLKKANSIDIFFNKQENGAPPQKIIEEFRNMIIKTMHLKNIEFSFSSIQRKNSTELNADLSEPSVKNRMYEKTISMQHFPKLNLKIFKKNDKNFEDNEIQFYNGLCEKLGKAIESSYLNNWNSALVELSKEFFGHGPSGKSVDMYSAYNEGQWEKLVNYIEKKATYWYNALDVGVPFIQILTVEHSRTHLRVRASSNSLDVSKASYIRISRKSSVTGIVLDLEDSDAQSVDIVPIDLRIQKNLERYASYNDNTKNPELEILVPIIVDGKIWCIVNLEFEKYRKVLGAEKKMLKKISTDIDMYVKFIKNQDEMLFAGENKFRYVITKLLAKLTHTLSHKQKNNLAIVTTCISRMKRIHDGISKGDFVEEFNAAIEYADKLRLFSEEFSKNIGNYISFGNYRLEKMVEDAVFDIGLEQKLAENGIEIYFSPNKGDDPNVFCSGIAKEHIFNILSNAFDSIQIRRESNLGYKGRINISLIKEESLDLSGRSRGYSFWVLRVADNGVGIGEDVRSRIYDLRFTTKAERGGTGFGLSAARDYMRAIGGDLVDEASSDGATFVLKFPMYVPELHESVAASFNVNG